MASPSSRPSDPEFDPPMIAWPPEAELKAFRKVVVNPFLAILGLMAWATIMAVIAKVMPPMVVVGTGLLAAIPFLIHYHCLDCGATGVLPRCGQHACSGVVARWRAGRRRRRGGWPRPGTQMVIWLWVFGSLIVLLAATRR